MTTISFDEFQQNLNGLIERVAAGERLVLVRDGRAVAELHPVTAESRTARPYRLCAGQFTVPDDFDAPLPDGILQEFEGQ